MAQAEPCTVADLAAGTTTVIAHPCLIWGYAINGGSANSTLVLYDNASAGSGTVVGRANAVIATNESPALLAPIYCAHGCTAVVAGTGATAQVMYTQSST